MAIQFTDTRKEIRAAFKKLERLQTALDVANETYSATQLIKPLENHIAALKQELNSMIDSCGGVV